MKYGQGIYKIIRDNAGWCVAKQIGLAENGQMLYHRVSNSYVYRGWAQAWSRRRKIHVVNY